MATPHERIFAAFIDRILRLKEEQDEIGAQVRDVYLEMKGVGYDKTAAGALVTELRKRDKDSAKFEEANAVLELYRLSYENAKSSHTHAHAHTREIIGEFQVPAQDSGGTALGESHGGKSNAARPASVDAHVNDGRLAGEVSNEVVTGGESAATNPAGSAARGQAALSGECPVAPLSDAISNEPAGTAATNPDRQSSSSVEAA